MRALEVIIAKNAEAAGREAGHAEADGNEAKRRAIFNAHFADSNAEKCSHRSQAIDLAFLTGFHKGESDG